MDRNLNKDQLVDVYSFHVLDEAKKGVVARTRHGCNVSVPIEIRHEIEERVVSAEVTDRARAGEHFHSSVTSH